MKYVLIMMVALAISTPAFSQNFKQARENQVRLKKDFHKIHLNRQKTIVTTGDRLADINSNKSECSATTKSIKCFYKKIELKTKNVFAKITSWLKAFFSFNLKLPSISTNKSTITNTPPSVGTVWVNRYGSGSNPVILLGVTSFSDPDGTVEKIRWYFGDGTSVELLAGEFDSEARVKHIYEDVDYHSVRVEVEDNLGAITSRSIYVETYENTQPTVSFAAEANPIDPLEVTLNINATDVDGGSTSLYAEFCPSLPTNATTQICNFPSAGDYPVTVVVKDQADTYITADTTLTIGGAVVKSTPIALYNTNKVYGTAPLTIDFDASSSFDLDGEIVSYEWRFSDYGKPGNFAQGNNVSYTFTQPGTYGVYLKVKDNEGNIGEEYGEIQVVGTSQVPHISIFNIGSLEIKIDGENKSHPVPASNDMIFWNFGDGNKASGRWPTHTYSSPGTYSVSLKYIDLLGVTHNLSKNITIEATNNSPIASFVPSQYRALIGQDIVYDASASSDPQDSDPLIYRWIFSDGEQFEDTDPEAIKQYDIQGLKRTNLVVTNSRGFSANTSNYNEINTDALAILPAIIFSPKVGTGSFTVNFNSSNTKSDLGTIVSHEWFINDEVSQIGENISHNYSTSGEHYFQYFATDSLGNQAMVSDKIISLASGVPGGNANPYASITTSVDPNNNRIVNYDCYSSTDSDDYVAYCEWKLNGVAISDVKSGTLNLNENIQYTLELKAIDNWGASTTVQRTFDFRVQPVAVIDYDYYPLRPTMGNSMTFGAEEAVIPGRTITQYHWNFGDSTSAIGQVQTHTYYSSGNFTVTLTLTDDLSTTYTKTKTITVNSSGTTSGFEIIARPVDLAGRTRTTQAYRAFYAPETIRFEALGLATSEGIMKDVVWNFGNSDYGYGENVEYTYFAPGSYTVSVTGKTPSNSNVSASMTVIIVDRGCTEKHTNTMCLKFSGITNNILSLASNTWTMTHSLGAVNYSTNSADYPAGWIYMEAQDGSEEKHYLDDAVTVSGTQLVLSREKILNKNINLNRPYRIFVKTMSTTAAYMVGESVDFTFGGSRLDIQLGETGTKLEVVHAGNMWRKYYDLSAVDEKILNNIPAGDYVVIATKGTKKAIRKIRVKPDENKTIDIDLDQELLISQKKRSIASKIKSNKENPPSWTKGLCGEDSPFDVAEKRNLSSVEFATRKFSSSDPSAQTSFIQLGRHTPRPTVLSCGVTTPAIMYGHTKWKYKEGPGRCNEDHKAHPYWKEYLSTLNKEDAAIVIAYEIKDKWAPEVIKGHFVTSARDIMLKNTLKIDDLSAKVGIGKYLEEGSGDFAQRIQYLLPIPVQFRRPEIKFQLISEHNTSAENYYSVECDIVDNLSPSYVSDLGAYTLNHSTLQNMDSNARVSLQKQFGFFPAQYDDRATSAVAFASEAGKVRYTVRVQTHENSNVTWQGADVEFIYGEESYTKFYPFLGVYTNSPLERSYVDNIVIDTADIENKFQWQPNGKKIILKITPVGKVSVDYDFRGEPKSFPFTALFDLQTVKADFQMLCSGGFNLNASSQLTTFVRDDLLSSLLTAASDLDASLKCGEASPPFGGPFDITSTWRYRSLKNGNEIFLRSINDSGSHEGYDDFQNMNPTRMADVDEYMAFSEDAKTISEIATEYDGMSNPTDKKLLYDFCHPVGSPAIEPCKPETVFSDLDHDMVLKICQWNMTSATMPTGCPSVDESRLIRFSKWVQKNATTFHEWTKKHPLMAFIGSGKARPLSSAPLALNWQKEALMKGVWPDGKPIWRADETLENLTAVRSADCHNNLGGCESLKSFFIDDEKYYRSISVMNGWK